MDKLISTIISKNKERIIEAKRFAKSLNDKFNKYPVPPILLKDIIETEGLVIKFKDFKDNIVAELVRDDKTIFITRNKELFNKWGNFAIAHELGHWFLHNDNIDYFDPTNIDSTTDTKNLEANCFAAYLLLPDELLRKYAWLDNEKFSSVFHVSNESIEFRQALP